ncbi:MAG: hypothetical protein V4634_21425 [Pseudomonadota bacterium]
MELQQAKVIGIAAIVTEFADIRFRQTGIGAAGFVTYCNQARGAPAAGKIKAGILLQESGLGGGGRRHCNICQLILKA